MRDLSGRPTALQFSNSGISHPVDTSRASLQITGPLFICPDRLIFLSPDPYEGSLALPYKDQVRIGPDLLFLVPVELPSYWFLVHNWTDLLHTPLHRNVVDQTTLMI